MGTTDRGTAGAVRRVPSTSSLVPAALGLLPFAWWLARTGLDAPRYGRSQLTFGTAAILVVPWVAVAVARVQPRLAAVALAAAVVAPLWLFGVPLGGRIVLAAAVPTALWALVCGSVAPPGGWLADRRPVRLAVVALVGLAVALVAGAPLDLVAGLGATSLVLAAAALAWTPLGRRVATGSDRLLAPFGAAAGPAGSVGRAVRAVVSLPHRAWATAARVCAWLAAPRPGEDPWTRVADRLAARPLVIQVLSVAVGWAVVAHLFSTLQLAFHELGGGGSLADVPMGPTTLDPRGKLGWGSGDYLRIADHGYRLDEHLEAAFPLYALVVRWLAGGLALELATAEIVVSTASGLVSTVLVWVWSGQQQVAPRVRLLAVVLFCAYPYSFVLYGTAYNDPFLLPLVLGAWMLVEAGRPVLAGVVGAAATFTRPNALPLVAGLLAFQLARSGAVALGPVAAHGSGAVARVRAWAGSVEVHPRRLGVRDAGVLLSIGGVGCYSYWMWRHAGDPLYFVTVQAHYGHRPSTDLATWLKVEFVDAPMSFIDHGGEAANHVLAAACLAGAVALLPALVRRLGWGYGTFAAGVVVISWLGPNGFAPAGRYLLPALPLYALVGAELLVDRPRMLRPLLATSVAAALALAATFGWSGIWLEW